jgi:adenylate kinase family enzyme
MPRIHVLGASGTGTTTLGAALAERLDVPHEEADSLFWLLTDPPYTTRREKAERAALLQKRLPIDGQWVFSGSALVWAATLEAFYDLIVFLRLDPVTRMERLVSREIARYGARIEPGGDMADHHAEFLAWAAAYDTAGAEQRSLIAHERWLAVQKAPVLKLDCSMPIQSLVSEVVSKLH